MMTLEQGPHSHYPPPNNRRRSLNSRPPSATTTVAQVPNYPDNNYSPSSEPSMNSAVGSFRRRIPSENGQSATYYRTSIEDYSPPSNPSGGSSNKQVGTGTTLPPTSNKTLPNPNSAANASSPTASTTTTGTTTTSSQAQQQRKHGAHRSQSARVVGSKPKLKRRAQQLQQQQQHLDLASSEGALRDCQDSYNPFLRKVPSTGRLVTTNSSGEMSSSSLYTSPSPQQQQQQQSNPPTTMFMVHQQSSPHSTPPRDSPKILRRQSTAFEVRRGSDKSTPEKEPKKGLGPILAFNTPESSPVPQRRASTKPSGLPKSPQVVRSTSTSRRANSVKGRRNTTFLDVPDINPSPPEDEDEESYRLRTFNVTSKGIVNRGDSFRRRRSRSNSLVPTPATTPELLRNPTFISEDGLLLPGGVNSSLDSFNRRSPIPSPKSPIRPFSKSPSPLPPSSQLSGGQETIQGQDEGNEEEEHEPLVNHRVAMIGSRGVGKAALVSQFMTSECINAYDRQNDVEGEETVSVMLNGEESELTFFKVQNPKTDLNRFDPPDAFVLVYSVVDRSSFQKAEAELRKLQEWDHTRMKAVVLVGNKIDLVRSRAVSTQDGRCLAVSFRVKFIEVSVGINHNVDELLVGLLHQIRLKQAQAGNQDSWCKHRGILRASVKARQMLTWLLGKEDAKFKNCENLHIL